MKHLRSKARDFLPVTDVGDVGALEMILQHKYNIICFCSVEYQ